MRPLGYLRGHHLMADGRLRRPRRSGGQDTLELVRVRNHLVGARALGQGEKHLALSPDCQLPVALAHLDTASSHLRRSG